MNSSDKDGNLRDATEIVKVWYGDIKEEKLIGLKLATKESEDPQLTPIF